MFTVWIDNEEPIDLYPDTAFNLEYNNAMFGSISEQVKAFSYPFKFPNSERNKKRFKFAHLIQRIGSWQSYFCTVKYKGSPIFEADLVFLKTGKNETEASLQPRRYLAWARTKLSEMKDLGFEYAFKEPSLTLKYFYLWLYNIGDTSSEIKCSADVCGKVFAGKGSSITLCLQNLINQVNADTLINATAGFTAGADDQVTFLEKSTAKPFYVRPLPLSSTENYYLVYVENDPNAHQAKTTAFANQVTNSPENYDFCYPQIGFKLGEETNLDGFVFNKHDGTTHNSNFLQNRLFPQLYVRSVIRRAAALGGWTVESAWLDGDDIRKLFIFNNVNYTWQTKGFIYAGEEFQGYEKFWFWADKLPEMTLLDLLDNLSKMFNLYVAFDYVNSKIRIKTINEILEDTNVLFYDSAPEYDFEPYRQEGFNYAFEVPSSMPDDLKASYKNVGVSGDDIRSDLLPIPMRSKKPYYYDGYRQALYYQLSEKNDQIDKAPPFLAFFYKDGQIPSAKVVTDSISLQYIDTEEDNNVFSGISGFFFGGSYVPLESTLTINPPTIRQGLYNKFWASWSSILEDSKLVSRTIYLNLSELLMLDMTKKIRIDNVNYLIKKLQVSLSSNIKNVFPCKVELLPILAFIAPPEIPTPDPELPPPPPINYTLTIAAEANGTASNIGPNTVAAGSNFTFSTSPNASYILQSVTFNGVTQNITNTNGQVFELQNIQSNIEVVCKFQYVPSPPPTYTVSFSAGTGGSSNPNTTQTVSEGANLSYTVSPISGYEIDTVTVNGTAQTINNRAGQTFSIANITFNKAVVIAFRALAIAVTTYKVTVNNSAGGTATPAGDTTVNAFASQNFTATPNSGQEIDAVTVNGVAQTITNRAGETFTIEGIQENKLVYVAFRATSAITYTVNVTAGANGTASPLNVTTVIKGADFDYSITPNVGYEIDVLTIAGSPVTLVSRAAQSRRIKNIQANTTVNVTFRAIAVTQYTIFFSIDGNMTSTPIGNQVVSAGSSFSYTLTPNAGYELDDFNVDGVTVVPTNRNGQTFTIDTVNKNYVIIGRSRQKINNLTVTLNLGGGNGTSDKGTVTGIVQGGSYSATITPNTGYEIDTIFLNGITPVAVTNRDLQTLSYSNIQANMVIDVIFRAVVRLLGNLSYAQLNPTTIRITRTFGGSLAADFASLSAGTPLTIEFNDSPNSNLIVPMSGNFVAVTFAGNAFDILGVLSVFQDAYRNQPFKASVQNLGLGFNKKFTGL